MPRAVRTIKASTREVIARIYASLDYSALATLYCDEGGEAFWRDRRDPCQELGVKLAEVLLGRLRTGGRSLYVGAGVAEVPILAMETMELSREVVACTLRADEAHLLNRACDSLPFRFVSEDARTATGRFDHLWIVSVLNDPERFPELSALSYGRANPVTFNPMFFVKERERVFALVDRCLRKLRLPGLVTTSIEEIPWITDWCTRRRVTCVVEEEDYPTAIVEDPVCFIRVNKQD
ncbi:MAG TPA: hypothetical protein VFL31_05245 [Nitrospiraceae bacterium]|nr:hypothetical protein [Nitrospiraceae bacterium]